MSAENPTAEHWLCTNCGTIDGARAGMVCHGPGNTGICMALGETVVEISPGAFKRLRGAVEALEAARDFIEAGAHPEQDRAVLAKIKATLHFPAGGQ